MSRMVVREMNLRESTALMNCMWTIHCARRQNSMPDLNDLNSMMQLPCRMQIELFCIIIGCSIWKLWARHFLAISKCENNLKVVPRCFEQGRFKFQIPVVQNNILHKSHPIALNHCVAADSKRLQSTLEVSRPYTVHVDFIDTRSIARHVENTLFSS